MYDLSGNILFVFKSIGNQIKTVSENQEVWG